MRKHWSIGACASVSLALAAPARAATPEQQIEQAVEQARLLHQETLLRLTQLQMAYADQRLN